MTLINDYKVEIVWIRKQLLIILCIILTDKLLIKCKKHLIGTKFFQMVLVFGIVNLMYDLFKGFEILLYGLIY